MAVRVEMTLTRQQATAILKAGLSTGHGVRRSQALVEAERRLMVAVRQGVDEAEQRRQWLAEHDRSTP